MLSPTEGVVLEGGTANRHRVIRVGNTVHRPWAEHTPAVHTLLDHLRSRGFDGAPRVVGSASRDDGADAPTEEILSYIPGLAATEPLADWALTDDAVHSVGALLSSFHAATRDFDGSRLPWQRPVPVRWRGTHLAHNDVNPGNVIFAEGRAVALIDFDLAAPACPAWDLAVSACFWAPLREAADVPDGRRDVQLRRYRLLLDGYGAGPALRDDVLAATSAANRWIARVIEDAARSGHPAFGRLWDRDQAMHRRAAVWLAAHRTELRRAGRESSPSVAGHAAP